jgi:hypothetical protein
MQNPKFTQTPTLTYPLSSPPAYAGGTDIQHRQETNNVI